MYFKRPRGFIYRNGMPPPPYIRPPTTAFLIKHALHQKVDHEFELGWKLDKRFPSALTYNLSWFNQWAFHEGGVIEVYIRISACRRQHVLSSTPCTRKWIVDSNLAGNSTQNHLRHWDRIHLGSVIELFEIGWMELYINRQVDNVGISCLR